MMTIGATAQKGLLMLGVVILLIAVGLATRSNLQARQFQKQLEELKQTQPQAQPQEVQQLVAEVSRLTVLPEGEQPTVATISNEEELRSTPFFAAAQKGDKVLIYVKARKAVLYRPDTQKIIEIATLNLDAADQNFTPKITLRNGTTSALAVARVEDNLTRALPRATIVGRENSANVQRTETMVIDLVGGRGLETQRIATLLGIKTGALPPEETKPENADFLILVGSDQNATSR
jgi:hypothetical protein